MTLRGPIFATTTAAAATTTTTMINRTFFMAEGSGQWAAGRRFVVSCPLPAALCPLNFPYDTPMQNMPVMLAPPPRRVPLSLALVNVFNLFAQIGWFVFGFGMIFAWAFVGNADFSAITFRGAHAQKTGTVTRVEETGASENRSQVVAHHYVFSVADTRYDGTSYSTHDRKSAGDTVMIEYDQSNPQRSRILGMRRSPFGPAVIFVLIFPLIGALFVVFSTASGLRRNRLLRNGLLAGGKLLGRERTNVTVNNRPVWKLTFEFTARDGQRRQATASTTDPSRLEDEAEEPLLYDPDNPTAAYVLDEIPARPQFEPNGELRGRGLAGAMSVIIPGLVIASNLLVIAFKMDWL